MTDFDLTSEKLPVVLLPGMDGTGTLFQEFVSILALERPVIVIAYPPDRPLSYTQLTSLVRAQLPTSRFFMLGESFSGPIAIEISASESDRVPGLILVSSFARNPFPKFLAPAAGAVDPR